MANNKISTFKEIRTLKAFDENNFKRWKAKIQSYLVDIEVSHVLDEEKQKSSRMKQLHKQSKGRKGAGWSHMQKTFPWWALRWPIWCYPPTVKITKEIWDAFNDKHDIKNVGKKKFLVSDLYDFKMIDDQSCYPKSVNFIFLCIKLLLMVPTLMNHFKFLQSLLNNLLCGKNVWKNWNKNRCHESSSSSCLLSSWREFLNTWSQGRAEDRRKNKDACSWRQIWLQKEVDLQWGLK